ncbi:hypothetical protein EMCRGX_G001430 [Ephydatia muelleri]
MLLSHRRKTAQPYCANCQKSKSELLCLFETDALVDIDAACKEFNQCCCSHLVKLIMLAITVLRIDYQLCFWSGHCPSAAEEVRSSGSTLHHW